MLAEAERKTGILNDTLLSNFQIIKLTIFQIKNHP